MLSTITNSVVLGIGIIAWNDRSDKIVDLVDASLLTPADFTLEFSNLKDE